MGIICSCLVLNDLNQLNLNLLKFVRIGPLNFFFVVSAVTKRLRVMCMKCTEELFSILLTYEAVLCVSFKCVQCLWIHQIKKNFFNASQRLLIRLVYTYFLFVKLYSDNLRSPNGLNEVLRDRHSDLQLVLSFLGSVFRFFSIWKFTGRCFWLMVQCKKQTSWRANLRLDPKFLQNHFVIANFVILHFLYLGLI